MEMEMANEEYGLGLVRSTSFGRKRVAPPNLRMEFGNRDECSSPRPNLNLKRQRSQDSFSTSLIESIPQEILISILCRVEHDDLKSLVLMSKSINKATLVAKESHFAFSTPKKTISILCRVEHDDLKSLVLMSKSINKATLVAKESHFAFSTPKKTVGFQSADFFDEFFDIEPPNAPKQSRVPRRRLSPKKLFEVAVNLFASGSEDNVDMETEN